MKFGSLLCRCRLAIFTIAVILFSGCSTAVSQTTAAGAWDYFPPAPEWAMELPSWEGTVSGLYSLIHTFFGREGEQEITRKIFRTLHRQTGLNLLSLQQIKLKGFDPRRPVTAAGYSGGRLILSVPVSDTVQAEKTILRQFKSLSFKEIKTIRQSQKNQLKVRIAFSDQFSCYLFSDRALFLYAFKIKPENFLKQKQDFHPKPFSELKNRTTVALIQLTPGALRSTGISLPFQINGRCSFSFEIQANELRVLMRSSDGFFDPLYFYTSTLLRRTVVSPADMLGWLPPGGTAAFNTRPGDLLSVSFSHRILKIWTANIRPVIEKQIRKQVERRIGKGLQRSLFTMFLPQKKLIQNALNALEIEKKLLEPLTGAATVFINNADALQSLQNPLQQLEEIAPTLLLEYKSPAAARTAFNHLYGIRAQLSRARLQIAKPVLTVQGRTVPALSISLFPWGIQNWLFVSVTGRWAILTPNIEQLKLVYAQFQNKYGIRGNIQATVGNSQFAFMKQGWNRYSIYLSLAKIRTAVSRWFDSHTRQNLLPFINQFDKIRSGSLTVQLRNRQLYSLLTVHLHRAVQSRNPFSSGSDSRDLILLLSGAVLAIFFIIFTAKFLINRRKFRG